MYENIIFMNRLIELAKGEKVFYIMTRLWDYNDKIKSERVEMSVLNVLNRIFKQHEIACDYSIKTTFVPFRDSSQEKINQPNKTKIIYERDLERLRKLFSIIGFYDGASKDEGMSFEIGYAFAVGAPIFIIRTDFTREELKSVPSSVLLFDPIIEAMASKILYSYKIPEVEASYTEKLTLGYEEIFTKLEKILFDELNNTDYYKLPIQKEESNDIYIDFGGGMYEWENLLQEKIYSALALEGFNCLVANRFEKTTYNDFNNNILQVGLSDIEKARKSKIIITCSDNNEMSAGTAAIQGMARALNKNVILYDSKTTNKIADGQYRSSRNLMIDFSADKIARKFDDIVPLVKEQYQEDKLKNKPNIG